MEKSVDSVFFSDTLSYSLLDDTSYHRGPAAENYEISNAKDYFLSTTGSIKDQGDSAIYTDTGDKLIRDFSFTIAQSDVAFDSEKCEKAYSTLQGIYYAVSQQAEQVLSEEYSTLPKEVMVEQIDLAESLAQDILSSCEDKLSDDKMTRVGRELKELQNAKRRLTESNNIDIGDIAQTTAESIEGILKIIGALLGIRSIDTAY